MNEETELTSYLLRHLYESGYFKSKVEMAEELGISEKQLQRQFRGNTKGGTIVLNKILGYMGTHSISMEPMLRSYFGGSPSEIVLDDRNAYKRIELNIPENFEGLENAIYVKRFIALLSRYICPNCKKWCGPWDGRKTMMNQNCFVALTAKNLIRVANEKDVTDL